MSPRALPCILVACLPLAAGCYPSAGRHYRDHVRRYETDSAPALSRGPVTVVANDAYGGTSMLRIDGGRERKDYWLDACHFIRDFKRRKEFSWGVCGAGPRSENLLWPQERYWARRRHAQRLSACTIAGEAGATWRYMQGPTFKDPRGELHEACITPDGVVLSEATLFAGQTPRVEWTATRVSRAPIAAAVFEPPADAR